jgi:Tfp pilus assembly protein PilO
MAIKEDLVKLKGTVAGWTSTEDGYRGFVAGLLLVIGWFAILGPLESRLTKAREDRAALSKLATWVEEIRALSAQTGSFEEHMVAEKNTTEWDNYINRAIFASGVKPLNSTERKPEAVMDYTFYIRDLMITGSFEQIVDFMDRLERGERYLRIDEFSLAPQNGELMMRATVRCWVGETTAQKRARAMGGGGTEFGGGV